MDPSFPPGSSVNDGIPQDTYLGERFKFGDLIIANFAIKYLYRYAKKFRN